LGLILKSIVQVTCTVLHLDPNHRNCLCCSCTWPCLQTTSLVSVVVEQDTIGATDLNFDSDDLNEGNPISGVLQSPEQLF